MYGYGYYPMYYDWTYILVLIGAVLSMIASANVNRAFNKYAHVHSRIGITGAKAAELILEKNGIRNVSIQGIRGNLTDNYMPSRKVLNLSDATRDSDSIAAIGVAAHECGHAIQDADGYTPLILTHTINPICAVASRVAIPLIFFGLIISLTPLINLGIIAFTIAISIQILTLPVEFNASRRALATLREYNILTEEELAGVRAVLIAAALTYVAAAASSLLQLLRLVLISRSRDDRN